MKTENIIGVLAILVSVGAVGCGAAPMAAAGAPSISGGGAGNGGTIACAFPETKVAEAPRPPSNEHVQRHGARMSHPVVHLARR
jgi:hypothetical protein